ncbi:MAG: glycosyltransferase family 2 protein [Magnetococcales bacterium]|nr:glycosyltransferase family 2 protein [Magnetococcales bacterium]
MTTEALASNANIRHVPQVSIGMPVYNGELFIREALDSLLSQTFTDFELIISDNASTDGTEAICREYAAKDERIRYVRQEKNKGVVANFKIVLDEAVGEYFMWTAADDRLSHNWIAELYPIVSESGNIAFGYVQVIDNSGNRQPHPANHRNLQYAGSRFIRKIKYFLDPNFLGKANPMYGLMPRHVITNEAFSILNRTDSGSDILFLYKLLDNIEIRTTMTAQLEKRIHIDCTGGGTLDQSESRNHNYFDEVNRVLTVIIKNFMNHIENLQCYGSINNKYDNIINILLMPFALIYYFGWQALSHFTTNMSRNKHY